MPEETDGRVLHRMPDKMLPYKFQELDVIRYYSSSYKDAENVLKRNHSGLSKKDCTECQIWQLLRTKNLIL